MTAIADGAVVAVRFRPVRRGLIVAVVLMLLTDVIAAYRLSTSTVPVTLSQAVARFRSADRSASNGRVGSAPGVASTPGLASSMASSARFSPEAAPSQGAGTPARGAVVTAPPALGPAAIAHAPAAVSLATPSARPGVYTYATDGHEQVSAVGGSQHTYPSQTTMTVTATGCGTDVRWDALQQRYDSWSLCAVGRGLALRSLTTYHDFFGQADRRVYTCTPDTRFRPDATAAGTEFGGNCSASGAAAALHGTVVGIEKVTVGSTPVSAVHVHLDERLTGATSGTRSSDSWYALSDNLLLRRTSWTDADTQTSFGPTHYQESVQLMLSNLQPAT